MKTYRAKQLEDLKAYVRENPDEIVRLVCNDGTIFQGNSKQVIRK